MGSNPSSQKKKKKRVKKPKNIRNSSQVNISLLTKQKKPKSVFLNKSLILNTKTKEQKNKKNKKHNVVLQLHSCVVSIFAYLYTSVLHTCQNPIALLSHWYHLLSLTLFVCTLVFLYSFKLYCMFWLNESDRYIYIYSDRWVLSQKAKE